MTQEEKHIPAMLDAMIKVQEKVKKLSAEIDQLKAENDDLKLKLLDRVEKYKQFMDSGLDSKCAENKELKDCLRNILKHVKKSNEPEVVNLIYLSQSEAHRRKSLEIDEFDSLIDKARLLLSNSEDNLK